MPWLAIAVTVLMFCIYIPLFCRVRKIERRMREELLQYIDTVSCPTTDMIAEIRNAYEQGTMAELKLFIPISITEELFKNGQGDPRLMDLINQEIDKQISNINAWCELQHLDVPVYFDLESWNIDPETLDGGAVLYNEGAKNEPAYPG